MCIEGQKTHTVNRDYLLDFSLIHNLQDHHRIVLFLFAAINNEQSQIFIWFPNSNLNEIENVKGVSGRPRKDIDLYSFVKHYL